jgi:hypothetical protein
VGKNGNESGEENGIRLGSERVHAQVSSTVRLKMTCGSPPSGIKKPEEEKKREGQSGPASALLARHRAVNTARCDALRARAAAGPNCPGSVGGLKPFYYYSFSNLSENCLLF